MRLFGLFAILTLACVATTASGQTFGPPIAGLCLLSRANAIGASRAGQSMQAQLKQMQASLNGELAQQRAGVDRRRRQLEAQRSAIAPVEFERQLAALNQQGLALEERQNARFIAAQTHGQQQIDRALSQALGSVITRSACSLVMERDHAYGWNNAMDLTPAVTREMDGILQAVVLP